MNPFSRTIRHRLQSGVAILIASGVMATLLATDCLARVDVIPPYSVSPEIHNLDISYFVKQDNIKINLYVINHEKFSVICDTQYEAGPDKKHGLQQTILPDKAVAFDYDYSKQNTTGDPHNVSLALQCVTEESTKPLDSKKKPAVEYYGDTPSSHSP